MRSQIATSSSGPANIVEDSLHGGRRSLPFVFTEQGVAMLSSALNSPRAVQVNIEIVRTFVGLRQLIASNTELTQRLNAARNFIYRFLT